MLYTEDFSMRHYVGFSQIGSHITICNLVLFHIKLLDEIKVAQNSLCMASPKKLKCLLQQNYYQ